MKTETKVRSGAHAALIRHFMAAWEQKYRRVYPIQPLDAVKASSILKLIGSLEEACDVVDRYLACDEKFYTGHTLAMLSASGVLPKFCVSKGAKMDGLQVKIDGERTERQETKSAYAQHQAKVATAMAKATAEGRLPALLEAYEARRVCRPRQIDPATNVAFREFVWEQGK